MIGKYRTAIRISFVPHLAIFLLLLLATPFMLIRLAQGPYPWFDEGINMLAARTLAETGQYGLPTASGIRLSDPAIQTGPPMVLLLAGLHKLVGANIGVMRLLSVVFGIAALIAIYALTLRLYNRFTAFLAIFLMLSMPVLDTTLHVILMSRQVLGEMPVIFLLTLGLLILAKESLRWWHYVLAGLCFGISIAIKSQVLVILTLSLGLWLMYCLIRQRQLFWQWVIIVVVMLMVYGVDAFWRYLMANASNAGNTAILMQGARIHLFPFRFQDNLTSQTTLVVLGIAALSIASVFIRRYFAPKFNVPPSNIQRVEYFLMVLVGLWVIWFGFVSIGWSRYGFIGHIFSLILLAPLLASIWQRLRLPVTGVVYAAMLVVAALAMIAFQLPVIREEQGDYFYDMVDYLKANVSSDAVIASWDLPLAYMADQPFEYPTTDITNMITAVVFDHVQANPQYDPSSACPEYLLYGSFSLDRQVFVTKPTGPALFQAGPYELYKLDTLCETRTTQSSD